MENKNVVLGKKLYSYKEAKTIVITTKILAFLLILMGIVFTFQSLILAIPAIFFGIFMFAYSTILRKIIRGNNKALSREGKKRHKKVNQEVKKIIKKAKKAGVHPSFIKLLKAHNKLKVKYKFGMEFYEGATEEELQKFEKDFGITIPTPYREFLKFTNGADLGEACVEFYGVSETAKNGSMYDMNYIDPEIDAYNIAGARNSNLLIFGMDIANYLIGINTETGEIASWKCEFEGDEYLELADDFYSYMEEELIGYIKDKECD